ncbi:MAG: UDP-N-acetylmuramate dehydrogenase [Pseudomonadota bacterium]
MKPAKYTGVRIEIQQNQWLTPFNTFGLAVRARYLVTAGSVAEVVEGIRFARQHQLDLTVLGGGSNVVLRRHIEGLVMRIGIPGLSFDGDRVLAGAGENWHGLVMRSIDTGLSGLENLSLIPGTVGAAPIQNIGAYGAELASVFESLTALDRETLEIVHLSPAELRFGYRDSAFKHELAGRLIITSVTFRLSRSFEPNLSWDELRQSVLATHKPLTARLISEHVCAIRRRKLPDPGTIGNLGSFFKNPLINQEKLQALLSKFPTLPYWETGSDYKVSAGWLIESCGLKGARIGDAGVSPDHALVLVNLGQAQPDDLMALADLIAERVSDRFDLRIEIEPSLVG